MGDDRVGIASKIEKRVYPVFVFGTLIDVQITCPKELSMADGRVLALLQVKTQVDDEYAQTDGETKAFNNRVQKACEGVFSREEVSV